MPSTSLKQKHFMAMVKAVQAGHQLEGVNEQTAAKVEKAADSMTPKQVEDFQTLERPKPRSLLRK